MLFDLPNDDILYQALLDRDAAYDGRAFVCVASTGVFCRLTCPARKPKRENCSFYETVGECLERGFRACKRCHPLQPNAMADPAIRTLLTCLDERPGRRWSEADILALGLEPSTVRRSFKRQYGVTFLEMARLRRLRDGFSTLGEGGKVIEAQLDAGFESASAFRAALIPTVLGDMLAICSRSELHLLEFFDRRALPSELARLKRFAKGAISVGETEPSKQIKRELHAFLAGDSADFKTPVAFHGSAFACSVWRALKEIPAGQTRSYAQIAEGIGQPKAARAVARANGANQLALIIPCHRVIGADGSLTGYGGGLWRKQKLLEIEQAYRR